jgi:hypothetical protein
VCRKDTCNISKEETGHEPLPSLAIATLHRTFVSVIPDVISSYSRRIASGCEGSSYFATPALAGGLRDPESIPPHDLHSGSLCTRLIASTVTKYSAASFRRKANTLPLSIKGSDALDNMTANE